MTTRLTSLRICQESLKRNPKVESLELKAGGGFYYVVGSFKNGSPFVSSGIFVFRLAHLSLDRWVEEINGRIDHEYNAGPQYPHTHPGE